MVMACDPSDGRELWRVKNDGSSQIPRPVFGHGMLFISTGYDEPTLMAIRVSEAGTSGKSAIAWSTNKAAPHNPSPLLVEDELFTVSDRGVASCFDARTGKIYWQKSVGEGPFWSSPVHADGKIYVQSEHGGTTVLRAGKTFEVLAQNEMGERTFASYAAADRALYLRTERHLYRIQAKSARRFPVRA